MLYKDLNKITLSNFIDIFLGDTDKVVVKGQYSQKEKEEASERLCNEYLSIVGGKSMQTLINRRNEIMKIHMRMCCFERLSLIHILIYESGKLIKAMRPKTFKQWYRLFCNLVGCKYNANYKPSNLKISDEFKKRDVYKRQRECCTFRETGTSEYE